MIRTPTGTTPDSSDLVKATIDHVMTLIGDNDSKALQVSNEPQHWSLSSSQPTHGQKQHEEEKVQRQHLPSNENEQNLGIL